MQLSVPIFVFALLFHEMPRFVQQSSQSQKMPNNDVVREDLKVLQAQRIYFGHQSVGANVIDGVKDILRENPEIRINLIQLGETLQLPEAFFAETFIGQNTQPGSKCESYVQDITLRLRNRVDIALMKFCYVDITKETDVENVLALYRSTIDTLKNKDPHVRFVHVTVPLVSITPGWKRFAKRVLGHEEYSIVENVKRNEFNARLRDIYNGEPIFDLAAVESTYPDGSRATFEYEGKSYYQLAEQYTSDGGHLNVMGRRIAARELIHALANVTRSTRQKE